MRATRPAITAAALCAVLAAQALPDPGVLAPEGCGFHLRLDAARLRTSELWRVVSHHAALRRWLESALLEPGTLELEQVDRIQIAAQSWLSPRGATSLYLQGAGWNAAELKDAFAAARAERFRELAETAEARSQAPPAFAAAERVGGYPVWFPAGAFHTTFVDLGPGMVWIASPPAFVRERLAVIARANPDISPDPALLPLLGLHGGDLRVLTSDHLALRLLHERVLAMAEGADAFTAMALRADFHPEVSLAVTGLAESEDQAGRLLAAVRARVAQCIGHFAARRVAFPGIWLKRIELTASGRTVTARLRIPAREITGIASAVGVAVALRERAEVASREQFLAERRQQLAREYARIFADEAESRPTAPESKPAK